MTVDGLFRHAASSLCLKVMTPHRAALLGIIGTKPVIPKTAKMTTDSLLNTTGLLISLVEESQAKTSMTTLKSYSSTVTMIHGMEVVSTQTSQETQ